MNINTHIKLDVKELEEWRRVLVIKIKLDVVMYIDAILFDSDYQKGCAHWDLVEHMCEYVTGTVFEEDSSLYLCLHTKTQKITDNLDSKIGLQISNVFREYSNRQLDEYATKLTNEIMKLIKILLGNNSTITRRTENDIPTKLVTPIGGMRGY